MDFSDKKESSILKVLGISRQFEGRDEPVLSGINLDLKEGEVVSLAGSSGSGKTSLLRIIAGLEETDTGEVIFRGKKVQGPSEKLIAGHESIRLVHQHFELAHRRTVYENIAQKLRHLHPSEQKEETLRLMEICRIGYLASKYVEELSGGEKQRLALARALAEEPELLLLDEPFSNLDPHLKEEIRYDLFNFIRERGLTVIMVSHDPKDALSLSDTIWVLRKGAVVQSGTPRQVYYESVSPEVAALFGRINLCRAGDLMPLLNVQALESMQGIDPESVLGFRPELLEVVPAGGGHLQGKVVETFFHGAASEAKVETREGFSFYLHLPAMFKLPADRIVHLKLNREYLRVWEAGEATPVQ